MNHIVYLNTDILNSYLSQINDGLASKNFSETQDIIKNSKEETNSPGNKNTNVIFSLPKLVSMGFSEDSDFERTTNILSQLESGRELIEKILHDNALEQFRKNILETELLNDINNCSIGNYTEISGSFLVRDFEYIINVYSDEYIDFLCDDAVKTLEDELQNNPGNTNKKILENKIKNIKSQTRKIHNNTRRVFNMAKNILPFSKFIICDNCIIPLESKYLRESATNIRFMYSQNINIIGKYTSTLKDAINREKNAPNIGFNKMFAAMDETFEAFYSKTLGLNESMKIILPIALYFE